MIYEGSCKQRGGMIVTGFRIEVESPLSDAALSGIMSGKLCGECASWIAGDVDYECARNDEAAHKEHRPSSIYNTRCGSVSERDSAE